MNQEEKPEFMHRLPPQIPTASCRGLRASAGLPRGAAGGAGSGSCASHTFHTLSWPLNHNSGDADSQFFLRITRNKPSNS